jgi:hypothetical protein
VWLEGLGKLKKFIHLIGSQTHDLPACSIALNHYATVCPINEQHTNQNNIPTELSLKTDMHQQRKNRGYKIIHVAVPKNCDLSASQNMSATTIIGIYYGMCRQSFTGSNPDSPHCEHEYNQDWQIPAA